MRGRDGNRGRRPGWSELLRQRLDEVPRTVWWLYALAVAFLASLWLVSHRSVEFSDLTRDPLAVARLPFYIGLVSNLGVVLWIASGAVALFSGAMLRRRDRAGATYLLGLGCLSVYLGLDDLLMLHERVYADHLNIRERYVLSAYILAVVAFFYLQRQRVLGGSFIPLLAAGAFFVLSLAFDKLGDDSSPWHHVFEDGAKFLGITSWFSYLVLESWTSTGRSGSGE